MMLNNIGIDRNLKWQYKELQMLFSHPAGVLGKMLLTFISNTRLLKIFHWKRYLKNDTLFK